MTAQPAEGVHARAMRADLAQEGGFQPQNGTGSACPGAPAGARVSHLRLVDQEAAGNLVLDDPPPPGKRRPGAGLAAALTEEARAAQAALADAAGDSDWAAEAMTPVAAWSQVAPRKGEADNWIIWTAMTVAGVCRGVLVSLGYLIARGGETRIRATVAAGAFLLALTIAFLAGHAS